MSGFVALAVATLLAGVGEGQHEAVVTWNNVSATAGCWFFVGPEDIGRDQRLGEDACVSRRGDEVTVSISGVPFRGRATVPTAALSRRSTHEHNGRWLVEQRLVLSGDSPVVRGSYTYTECEPTERGCTGTCQIRADVEIRITQRSCGAAVADHARGEASFGR